MQIVSIFAESLFSLHYDGEDENEYERLMDLWTDISYLRDYAKANQEQIKDIKDFMRNIIDDAENIQDLMLAIENGQTNLATFFRPLNDLETGTRELSLQKGKLRKSYLRLYALRIDEETFLLTGGAIKLQHKMQDSEDTMRELSKLKQVQDYLKDKGVFDAESFYELRIENNHE